MSVSCVRVCVCISATEYIVSVCTYVLLYVYEHVFYAIYVHNTCVRMYTFACLCAARMCIQMCVCVCARVACVYVCVRSLRECVCALRVCLCECVCCVCVCVSVCVLCVCVVVFTSTELDINEDKRALLIRKY